MGCATCSTINGEVSGCQNNGSCQTGGCNKLNTFDWLSNMDMPSTRQNELIEVRFKNGRKDFFKNNAHLDITTGDAVIVDVPNGHHLGHVSMMGELVLLQMRKKNIDADSVEIRNLYRIANQKDIDRYRDVRNREMPTMFRTRQILSDMKLGMKLTDVEFQADNSKATFYYSAEDRVDFRELIKILAGEFKIRVEMRQISLREEAGRLGGIGSCGRELCCSTWLSDFKSVSTQAARYQNLSLNPSKLSGQCGRLKCCLNYELDTYMEALQDIPEIEEPLSTERGMAKLQKTDIFRKIMWFGYNDENSWHPIDVSRVNAILKLNREGKKPATLFEDALVDSKEAALNSDLEAMDKKYTTNAKPNKKKKRNKKRKNRPFKPNPGSDENNQ